MLNFIKRNLGLRYIVYIIGKLCKSKFSILILFFFFLPLIFDQIYSTINSINLYSNSNFYSK